MRGFKWVILAVLGTGPSWAANQSAEWRNELACLNALFKVRSDEVFLNRIEGTRQENPSFYVFGLKDIYFFQIPRADVTLPKSRYIPHEDTFRYKIVVPDFPPQHISFEKLPNKDGISAMTWSLDGWEDRPAKPLGGAPIFTDAARQALHHKLVDEITNLYSRYLQDKKDDWLRQKENFELNRKHFSDKMPPFQPRRPREAYLAALHSPGCQAVPSIQNDIRKTLEQLWGGFSNEVHTQEEQPVREHK